MKAVLAALIALGLLAPDANAQKYPEKTVRIVTPFGPGGGTDIYSRLIAQRLTERWGQQVIVENRPGAGSLLGTELVAKSPPDGYTLLITSASYSFNPGLYANLRFDPYKDFVPVTLVIRVPHVVSVLPSFPAKNLREFVNLARAQPGDVLYASSGPGSAMHIAGAYFGIVTNTKLTHVPYKGGAATVTAVLGGEATTAFNTLETVISQIKAARIRALAVSTRERTPALPDAPTAMESGIKDYEVYGWFGFMAPAGTPPAIVEQLSGEINKVMATPAMRDRVLADGGTPVGTSPSEFQKFLHNELAKWTRVIKQAGIKGE